MTWIHANWPYISLVLLGISEILGATPSIQANGIVDAVVKFAINTLSAQAGMPQPQAPAPQAEAEKK